MTWALATTAFSDRRARKFLTKYSDLRPRFAEALAQLATDPFQPGLTPASPRRQAPGPAGRQPHL